MLPLGLGPVIVSMLVNYYPAIFMHAAAIMFILLSVWAQLKNPFFVICLWIQKVFFGGGVISFLQESVGDVLFHGEDAG